MNLQEGHGKLLLRGGIKVLAAVPWLPEDVFNFLHFLDQEALKLDGAARLLALRNGAIQWETCSRTANAGSWKFENIKDSKGNTHSIAVPLILFEKLMLVLTFYLF